MKLVLASASPRRLTLLQQIGLKPEVRVADIDETPRAGELAEPYVLRMAQEKAAAVTPVVDETACVIAADTTIALDGAIIGKPDNEQHARAILQQLSGRSHTVLTAVTVSGKAGCDSRCVATSVSFRALSDADIHAYWLSGEPRGKAGAYAIQGLGACFVSQINGSYSAVMGLPLFETAAMLAAQGLDILSGWPEAAAEQNKNHYDH